MCRWCALYRYHSSASLFNTDEEVCQECGALYEEDNEAEQAAGRHKSVEIKYVYSKVRDHVLLNLHAKYLMTYLLLLRMLSMDFQNKTGIGV